MSLYQDRTIRRFPRVERVTWKQLHAIYAMQKRLGIQQTWDTKMSKLDASKKIGELKRRLSNQTTLL